MNCKARQYSDQMHCGYCGLQWDVNDPEPPKCRDKHDEINKRQGRATFAHIWQILNQNDDRTEKR